MQRNRQSHAGRTPARRRSEQERLEFEEATDRKVHDFFWFWKLCSEKPCRRAHACVGELRPCYDRHWPQVPEEAKTWFRAAIKASVAGHTDDEIFRIADAEVERIEALRRRAPPQ